MIRDGLWDVYNNVHMGTCGDRCAEKYNFTRQQQDDFAVTSFKRALEAAAKGFFAREIEPVQVKAGNDTIAVTEDETPKKFNEEKLRKLRPAFGEKGTITAGHARALLPLGDEHEQVALAERIERDGLSVRDVERIVSEQISDDDPQSADVLPGPALRRAQVPTIAHSGISPPHASLSRKLPRRQSR